MKGVSGSDWRAFSRVELRRLGAAFRRGCLRGTLCYALCLWVLVAGNMLFDGCFARSPFDALLALVAAALYLLITGLVFGMAIGLLAVGWAMVRHWVILPIVAVPIGVIVTVWLGADILTARAHAVLDALAVAAAERDWLVSGAGKAAHAGPIALVVVLPLLFLDLGALLIDPNVLAVLALLILSLAGLVAAGAVPAALLSLLFVVAVYLRSLRGRWKTWSRIPH
jgi:hypothetical protein